MRWPRYKAVEGNHQQIMIMPTDKRKLSLIGCSSLLANRSSQRPHRVAVFSTARESWICLRHNRPNCIGRQSVLLLSLSIFIAIVATGCSVARPSLGAISVTSPNGTSSAQVTSVVVSLSVDVTLSVSNDPTGLGVDWSLVCGGSAVPGFTTNVCGTITPVHVGSNISMVYLAPEYVPIGNTVTLTANATSDPSQSVSVTLTILPQPVVVEFSQGFLPPAGLAVGGTAQMAATVTNDPTYAGVNWTVTCGSAACGSFNPTVTASGSNLAATVYTAPAAIPSGGTVTVAATSVYDSTKSVSAVIQINPISVAATISPNPVPEGGHATLTATVSWDLMEEGVTWAVPSCTASDCGTITPGTCSVGAAAGTNSYTCTAIYTTPASLPAGTTSLKVSETATSKADPTKSGAASFTVAPPPPISVSVGATPAAVQVGGTTSLSAIVSYDFSDSGVNWQCSPACGLTSSTVPSSTTNTSATYTTNYIPFVSIPAGSASTPVVVTATSIAAPASDPTGSGSTTLTVYQPISVALTTQPVTAGMPATFSATVTNDIAPGGVDWTATGCLSANCGTFNSGNPNAPDHTASGASITYTAPANIRWPSTNPTVTIRATSTASETIPPLQMASAQVAVTPTTFVQFVPFAPSNLPVGNPNASSPTLVNLIATAVNDSTNQGVDWTVSCSDATVAACGQFLQSPEMVATATTADVATSFWPYSATVHAASGQAVAYQPPTQTPTGGTVTLTAASTADPAAGAAQVVTITSNVTGPALSGKVQVGNLPVSGASVELVVAGNTGYGSASSPLVISNGGNSVTTASDGSFTIPAGYTCPSLDSLLYLVALGGRPGGPQGSTNPQLGLMTAVGPCSILNGSVILVVNEVTTVASAFALAPFMAADYAHIGSSSANYNSGPNLSNASNNNNGLANAFATVNNLVDITTGQALLITPAGNGTAPQAEVNTLADAIDTCAVTAGGAPGDGSACDAFFQASNVNPPGGAVSTTANAPTSILQAVLEVAQVPSTNRLTNSASGMPLYSLAANPSFNAPFLPILTAAPFDWSIAITYTGGGLEGEGAAIRALPSGIALDASGNLWISNKNISSVTELTNTGAAISPFATGTTKATAGGFEGGGLISPRKVAIDPYGDTWVLNGNSTLSELALSGAPLTTTNGFSGAGNTADAGAGIAIDGTGTVWVADTGSPGDLAEYAGYPGGVVNGASVATGTPLSPPGLGFVNGINDPNGAIAIDGSENVWLLNQGNYTAVELSSTTGQLLDTDQGDGVDQSGQPLTPPQYILGLGNFGVSMAINSAGDIFIPNNTAGGTTDVIYELLAGASSSNQGGIGEQINSSIAPIYPPLTIDGAGHIWIVVQENTNSGTPQPIALAELASSGTSLNFNGSAQGLVAASVSGTGLAGVASDASGNVWVVSGNGPSNATEFVGVATPVVTPTSVALERNKLGSKP